MIPYKAGQELICIDLHVDGKNFHKNTEELEIGEVYTLTRLPVHSDRIRRGWISVRRKRSLMHVHPWQRFLPLKFELL